MKKAILSRGGVEGVRVVVVDVAIQETSSSITLSTEKVVCWPDERTESRHVPWSPYQEKMPLFRVQSTFLPMGSKGTRAPFLNSRTRYCVNPKDFITEHWKRLRSKYTVYIRNRKHHCLKIKAVFYFNCLFPFSTHLSVACLTNEDVSTNKIMRRELHLSGYVCA